MSSSWGLTRRPDQCRQAKALITRFIMPFGGQSSERALILAPHGRDAEIASKLFQEAGWPTLICADIANWCAELQNGAAFSVVVEEALNCRRSNMHSRVDQSAAALVRFSYRGTDQSHGAAPGRQTIADRLSRYSGQRKLSGATLPPKYTNQCCSFSLALSSSTIPSA